jgi:hypothetical protein
MTAEFVVMVAGARPVCTVKMQYRLMAVLMMKHVGLIAFLDRVLSP